MSNWDFISVSDQYARFPELSSVEVKKLQEWTELQPHLPDISGELNASMFTHRVLIICQQISIGRLVYTRVIYLCCVRGIIK